jgi:hypothetical protein
MFFCVSKKSLWLKPAQFSGFVIFHFPLTTATDAALNVTYKDL